MTASCTFEWCSDDDKSDVGTPDEYTIHHGVMLKDAEIEVSVFRTTDLDGHALEPDNFVVDQLPEMMSVAQAERLVGALQIALDALKAES